jgi:hypothetical protein
MPNGDMLLVENNMYKLRYVMIIVVMEIDGRWEKKTTAHVVLTWRYGKYFVLCITFQMVTI